MRALLLKRQESVAINHIAVHDDAGDAARVPDIRGRIGVQNQNIGAAAGGDLAQFIPAELDRVVVGGGGQSLARLWRGGRGGRGGGQGGARGRASEVPPVRWADQ